VFKGILDRIKMGDSSVAADAAARSIDARQAQAQSLQGQREGYIESLRSGERGVESLTPEVLAFLSQRERANEDPMVSVARRVAARSLYEGGVIPSDIRTPAGQSQLQGLLAQMGVGTDTRGGGSDSLSQLAVALAEANARQRPNIGAGFHGAMAGVNNQLAQSGLARGALYSGIAAGGAATVPLVTTAGQQLIALMENLGQEQEAEQKSSYGVQV
jgi:hypothetical protein